MWTTLGSLLRSTIHAIFWSVGSLLRTLTMTRSIPLSHTSLQMRMIEVETMNEHFYQKQICVCDCYTKLLLPLSGTKDQHRRDHVKLFSYQSAEDHSRQEMELADLHKDQTHRRHEMDLAE